MATPPALAMVTLALAFMFAGCVGSDASAPSSTGPGVATGPADYDDASGGIDGLVTDEELVPLAGAQAGLVEFASAQALTDVEGRFALSQVPPGTYTLAIQKLGYEALAKKVEVRAGELTELQVALPVLPIEGPWAELLIHDGVIKNGVGVVRTATCDNCGTDETYQYFPDRKLPDDFMGIKIESTWNTQDTIGIDLVDREIENEDDVRGRSYWRIRSQSPISFLAERCGDYTVAPFHAKYKMPCLAEDLEADQTHIENWYIGSYQEETHNLDPVCQQPVPNPTGGNVVNGYKAGCYGLGFVAELRYTNYMTIFHVELPGDAESYSAIPDA